MWGRSVDQPYGLAPGAGYGRPAIPRSTLQVVLVSVRTISLKRLHYVAVQISVWA